MPNGKEGLSNAIKELVVDLEPGRFSGKWLESELEIRTAKEKDVKRQTLKRLQKAGVIEYYPDLVGVYRKIDGTLSTLDWRNADPKKILKLKFPFQLENYVEICPKNIVIAAGDKDAGKTALLLNIARLNMNKYKVVYFSSEMGELELRRRLIRFEQEGLAELDDWKCEFVERDHNFADVIHPNDINIIDFLEVYDDFFKVGAYINQIYRRLNNGVAIIALQKNTGAEYGVGKDRSKEKARLYVTMGGGKLQIKVAKNWANENVNPVGKEFKYSLIKGCKFMEKDSDGFI